MSFHEKKFRKLASDTEKTLKRLGITSYNVYITHKRFTNQLVEFLRKNDSDFSYQLCLDYVNSIEHDPPCKRSSSYVTWKAFHHFIHLLDEQQRGVLTKLKVYRTKEAAILKSEIFNNVLFRYKEYQLHALELAESTVTTRYDYAKYMLLYFENKGMLSFDDINCQDVSDYLISDHFSNRSSKSVQNELYSLRLFLIFIEDCGIISNRILHSSILIHRVNYSRIITTISYQQEKDLLKDVPKSSINKRDKAVVLLALHAGLRTCDIRALKFTNINWEKQCISIVQSKTHVPIQIPIDSETQNAIIDYILNERRNCDLDYIFISGTGPARKLGNHQYKLGNRLKGSDSENALHSDGLHILRRTFATRLLNSGVELPVISEMLGQISRDNVQCYLSVDEKNMKRCSLSLSLIPYMGGVYHV